MGLVLRLRGVVLGFRAFMFLEGSVVGKQTLQNQSEHKCSWDLNPTRACSISLHLQFLA